MIYKDYFIGFLLISLFSLTGCKNRDENKKGAINPASAEVKSVEPALQSTIHQVALDGKLSEVIRMLSDGLDVNMLDKEGRTALMYAAFNGHTDLMKQLIEKGAMVNLCDSSGRTALMMASSGPFPEAVKLLLNHYADPDMADKEEHFTALMYASAEGQLEVVRLLLAHKADLTMKDIDGDVAMVFAEKNGHKEVANLLRSFKK